LALLHLPVGAQQVTAPGAAHPSSQTLAMPPAFADRAAATALGTSKLTAAQRQALIARVAEAGPLTLPLLVKAFYRTPDKPTAIALAKALVASPGARALPAASTSTATAALRA
jgi:hypothetical protein